MNVASYEEFVRRVWKHGERSFPLDLSTDQWTEDLLHAVVGAVEEQGEVMGKIKRLIRDKTFDREALLSEFGDDFYYRTVLYMMFGFTIQDVAVANERKLTDRLNRGVLGGSGDRR